MADPTSAVLREAFHYLVYGDVWDPLVDDSYASEAGLEEGAAPTIGAPLMLTWTNEGRTINGTVYTYGTPDLRRISQSSGGFTGYRWLRTVNRPTSGLTTNEPIRQTADGVSDDAPSFDISGWSDSLGGGFGGSTVSLIVHDPGGLYSGIFVEGRSVAIYVEEYEDGVLKSGVELFSGFVDAGVDVESVTYRPAYQFTASTIERLIGREGMDGNMSCFISEAFEMEADVVNGWLPQGGESVISGLFAARPAHIMTTLNVHKVLAHIMTWHLWVYIDGTRYRLAAVCDLRCDWWNLSEAGSYSVPVIGLPPGNVLAAVAGMLSSQGLLMGYSFRTSDLTITPDHEFKQSPDDVLDSIHPDYVYSVKVTTGPSRPVGQVRLAQTPIGQDDLVTEGLMIDYPTTRDSRGSRYQFQPEIGVLIQTQAGGERIARGLYQRENARRDLIAVHLPGATFGLHNLLTWGGTLYSVERVTHLATWDWLGPHETVVLARRVDDSRSFGSGEFTAAGGVATGTTAADTAARTTASSAGGSSGGGGSGGVMISRGVR